ncbi:MAG: hypothetical protein IPG77_04925 [Betaproteobacteria bacterium]|nr:hypothetical protein [Betaproteobacteria bacterium]
MSKYKYLEVQACYPTWFSANINLPDEWDMLTDEQRLAYIKAEAGTEMLAGVRDNEYEFGKQFRHLTAARLDQWSVFSETRRKSTPLAEVVTKPEALLILDGTYEKKSQIDWDDDD